MIVLGAMSGTSADGLDLALCRFTEKKKGRDQWEILKGKTFSYTPAWRARLKPKTSFSFEEFLRLERDFTAMNGALIREFLSGGITKPAFIAHHGHTIFHLPTKGVTHQLLNGAMLAVECQLPTVCDFRRSDVALGGQGAPLVTFADKNLFGLENHNFINLGGIANITFETDGVVSGFDLCPCNGYLNRFSEKMGKAYDKDGKWAKGGKVNKDLLGEMMALIPKSGDKWPSLSVEVLEKEWEPMLERYSRIPVEDMLASLVEMIALTINRALSNSQKDTLISGGGANNSYLVERITQMALPKTIKSAPKKLIEFKEALVFAWMGKLRWQNKENTLPEVTGASRAVSAGAIYLP